MKKIKKIFLVVFSVIFVGFILQQSYYRIKYEGNLVFYIFNESLIDSAQLEIFIDDIKVVDDKIKNKMTYIYKKYTVKTIPGNHTVFIKINGDSTKEIKLNTFLVTFVSIDYYGDRLNIPGFERDYFNIDIQKCPLYFIA